MMSAAQKLHLNHIATFIAVVEAESFRAAADRICISQSAVSVRIQQLEERLGVPLLHRTTRSVKPTQEGWRFFAVAKGALGEMDRIALELREEAVLQRGLVAVAAMPSVAATLLPKAIAALSQRHPGLMVRQVDIDSRRILEMVRHGEVELGLTSEPIDDEDLEFTPLFSEDCVLVIRKDHAAVGSGTISLAHSLSLPLLVSPRGSKLREVIDGAYRRAGLRLAPAQEAWQMLTLERLVAAGIGAAIMPTSATEGLDPAVFSMLCFKERFGRTVGVLRGRNRSESPATRAVRELLLELF